MNVLIKRLKCSFVTFIYSPALPLVWSGITLNPVGTRQPRSGLLSAGRHASSMHGQYSIQRIIIIISRGYLHLLTPPSHPDPDTLVAIHSLAYCQQSYPQMEIKS